MKPVVKFTIRQAVFINVLFVLMTVTGVFSLLTIPVENMPMVDIGKVFIHTVYFGASADDVEQLVTKKIEDALDGLENVEFIQSNSYRNFSSVVVKFIDDTNYRKLYDELRFRVLNIKSELPASVDDPSFVFADTNIWLPVIVVNLTGDMPRRSLKLYGDDLKTQIMNIPGVRNVSIYGGYEKEFHVSIDPAKLRQYGVTFNQVTQAIESANVKIPTGRFQKNDTEFMLDTGRRLDSQEEVLNIIVRKDGDRNFVRIRDLATSAMLSHRDPSNIPSVNGKDAIRLFVVKQNDGNAVKISQQVRKISKEFEKLHRQDGIEIIFTNDSTYEINDTVHVLGGNLILGMILVSLILWVSIGFRNALLTAIGIPFSLLCSIAIMKFTGISLNTICLFAFVLVSGMIVDDAIIIVENVFRHIQMGKTKYDAVVDGAGEVMIPVISSVLTTIVAFLPMLLMTGSTGEFFSYIPKTVSYALGASLFESIIILPIHILDWGPKKWAEEEIVDEDEDPFHHLKTGLFSPFWKLYYHVVQWLLNHKLIALGGIGFLFIATVVILVLSITGIMPLIKVKFFPGNYFRYHVPIIMPVGTPIDRTDAVVKDLSRYIMSLGPGQADSAAGSAGYYEDEDYQRHSGNNFGQIVVTLPEEKDRSFPENPTNDPMIHLNYIRNKIQSYIKETYRDKHFTPIVRVFEESDGPPTGKAVNIRVTALTMADALQTSEALMQAMKKEPELSELIDLTDDRPDFHKIVKYTAKQEASYEYHLNPGIVTALVAGTLNGQYVGKFRTIDEEVDLLVRIARTYDPANPTEAGLSDPLDVLNVPVVEHSAAPVLLRDLVDVKHTLEPSRRTRYKGKPTITITADIKSGSKLSPARVHVLVTKLFETMKHQYPGTSISFGGEFESTSKSYRSLTFAFFVAILAIYMILSSQFNDYFQPMIILSAVPFALIGVVMGLFVSRTIFTIGSFMAVVGLAGVAVNDSLIMIDFMNKRRLKARPLRDAVIESCAARMRPVLLTTITTILGLLPMAIGIPRKSISWSPMATAFVAGLSSATILALLIIPVEYELFEKIKVYLREKITHKKCKTES